ncbi:MAG: ATP-dependent helicase [Paludisphaera borealis]|uniref:ATP-dependent helicase n=1 Tax=Paludisphaera borealis TaxID=1387353 RepID=UPI002848AD59|nr:ATP-dependent helicase [Paludisphaera borealis]MDR3618859.1 ATP-dependent helicase [Paludisphaera borealis]
MRKITLKHKLPAGLDKQFADELNSSQRAAATAPDGYNLILAGPGSGKTRVITFRVGFLIARGVPADSILLATFTRRAAREMVGRLGELVGNQAGRVWAGTFHHVGNRLLRGAAKDLGFQSNFTILDSEDQTDLLRLAMDDAGLVDKSKLAPKASQLQHLISFAINTRRPLTEVVASEAADQAEWLPEIEKVADAYARRKLASNCMDYDDLLTQWLRLLDEFPNRLEEQGRMFRHILIDEMQDTNALQIEIVEKIAAAGPGNLTAVGDDAQSIYRFRGANYDNILKFPDRHPDARVFRLEVNYRSTPQIVSFTEASIAHNQSGFPKQLVSARTDGPLPVVVATADVFEEAALVCQQILEAHDQDVPLGRMAVLYRNHYDSVVLQGELLARNIPYTVRSGMRFFEQAHVKDVMAFLRVVLNPRDEASWRRLFVLLPGVGPAKAGAVYQRITSAADPLKALATAETMAIVPTKSRGLFAAFVNDLNLIRATDPEHHPARAIEAVLKGGYPGTIRQKYDKADNRIKDVEQFAVLAAKYDSLERLLAELLLAGDVYGMDAAGSEDPQDVLVLSTVHQAKGLEWSHVFVVRLVDEGFPHRRAMDEPGGEDEERRIFYVAVSRAMNELMLTYPSTISRGGYGPTVFSTPSRFLTEIHHDLYERVVLEHEFDRLNADDDDEDEPPWTGRPLKSQPDRDSKT